MHLTLFLYYRTVEVDYDTDESGIYRAKEQSAYSKNAPTIMDSSTTKINTPIELLEAKEIDDEEFYATSKSLKTLHLWSDFTFQSVFLSLIHY